MSGVDLADGREVRKGAASSVREWVRDNGGTPPTSSARSSTDLRGRRHPAGGG